MQVIFTQEPQGWELQWIVEQDGNVPKRSCTLLYPSELVDYIVDLITLVSMWICDCWPIRLPYSRKAIETQITRFRHRKVEMKYKTTGHFRGPV